MKYLKKYESIFDKMYEKLPEVKLAIALSNFINSINSEFKCNYMRNSDGLWIITHDNIRLIYLEIFLNKVNITFFSHHKKELTDNILYFLLHDIFNTDIIDVEIYKKDIPELINKLTKENYDNFLMVVSQNKYNL